MPAPLGPSTQMKSPGSIRKLTSASSFFRPGPPRSSATATVTPSATTENPVMPAFVDESIGSWKCLAVEKST